MVKRKMENRIKCKKKNLKSVALHIAIKVRLNYNAPGDF